MDQERAQELRNDVEKRLHEGKSYSVQEIRQIMKESGLWIPAGNSESKSNEKKYEASGVTSGSGRSHV